MKTRLMGNKENNSQNGQYSGSVKLNINLTRKRFQEIHGTLNETLVLSLGLKTHDPLLKPFFFSLRLTRIRPLACGFDSSVGRPLHWHRRGRGFESRS